MGSRNTDFAALLAAAGRESFGSDNKLPSNLEREVQVTGIGEVCRSADRVLLRVSVSSSKESVSDVTSSVSRRLDYILQTVRQNGVKHSDSTVRKFLRREEDHYHMDAEVEYEQNDARHTANVYGVWEVAWVMLTFSSFDNMERVCSVLQEKLDYNVCVGTPHYFHSSQCLSQMRQHAFASAVSNAQQKAKEVSEVLMIKLGSPLLVREEETREKRDEDEEEGGGKGQGATTLPHFLRVPTITAFSRVSVSFSIKDRGHSK